MGTGKQLYRDVPIPLRLGPTGLKYSHVIIVVTT